MTDHPTTPGPSYGTPDPEYFLHLAGVDPADDGPVWMVNLMKYKDKAVYDGVASDDVSGREADERYFPIEILTDIGAEVVFVGEVEDQLLGDEPRWDRVAVVKYPTRRSFVDMNTRDDFQAKHVHKEAGMDTTIVSGTVPMPNPEAGLDPSAFPSWDDVPHPPTDDDGPVVVLHFIAFHDGKADTDMVAYQQGASKVAVPNGVRIDGWFAVEGTILGDGRSWDQARFNAFPSKRAFMEVVMDPERLEHQKNHREVAIADTYTMILRPVINTLRDSVEN